MSNYMSDELSGDIKRDEMVSKGKMSQADADKERQLWIKVRFAQRLFWYGSHYRLGVVFLLIKHSPEDTRRWMLTLVVLSSWFLARME
jgi:hypothetical protein